MKSCNGCEDTFQRSTGFNPIADKANLTDFNTVVSVTENSGQNRMLKKGTYKISARVPYLGDERVYLKSQQKSINSNGKILPVNFNRLEISDIKRDGKTNEKTARIETVIEIDDSIDAKKVIQTASLLGAGKAKEAVFFEEIKELKNIDKITLVSVLIGILGTAWILFK